MEEKDSLAVYYGKNFWTAPQGAPAQAVPVDWQFTWAGHLCRIPALYVSDAGCKYSCRMRKAEREA